MLCWAKSGVSFFDHYYNTRTRSSFSPDLALNQQFPVRLYGQINPLLPSNITTIRALLGLGNFSKAFI
jgi:hypothetical protein